MASLSMAPLWLSIWWLVYVLLPVSGFNFSIIQARECDPLSLSWSGGHSPFQLLIIPPGGTMANISIPASAYNNGSRQGSYTLPQLRLKEEQQFMLSMSDATGMFAGGTSNLLTVGAAQTGQPCNTTFPSPDFTFSLDSDLAQCSPFPVTLYPGPVTPVLPVRLLVNIPQGQSFVVTLPLDSSWTANLTTGTPAAFTIIDAQDRNGGTEMLRVAKATNDTSCLVQPSTSTTPSSATPTGTTTQHTHLNTIGLAVGISVGGFAILCIALIFFWHYRRRQLHAKRPTSFLDLSDSPLADPSYHMVNVYTTTGSSDPPSKGRPRQESLMSERFGGRLLPITTRPAETQGTSSVSVYTPRTEDHPSDIILHRDITETTRPIEYPPEYSANFPPIPNTLLRNSTNEQNQMYRVK